MVSNLPVATPAAAMPGTRPPGPGARRRDKGARPLALGAVLLALAAMVFSAGAARAQDILVWNDNAQDRSRSVEIGSTNDLAVSFTTGAWPVGSTLTSIDIDLTTGAGTTPPTVTLRSGSADGTVEATLTGPSALGANQTKFEYTFTPPANTRLQPSTTYWVVAEGGSDGVKWHARDSGIQQGATGWDIGNEGETRGASSSGAFSSGIIIGGERGGTFDLKINGTPDLPPPPTGHSALVHNLDQLATDQTLRLNAANQSAQVFRTGANTHGYDLRSVELAFTDAVSFADIGDLKAGVWTLDGLGHPMTEQIVLANPAQITRVSDLPLSGGSTHRITGNTAVFTAPAGSTLAGSSTPYAVVLSFDQNLSIFSTSSDTVTTSAGFTIDNAGLQSTDSGSSWATQSGGYSLSLRVNGAARTTPPPSVSIAAGDDVETEGDDAVFTLRLSAAAPASGLTVNVEVEEIERRDRSTGGPDEGELPYDFVAAGEEGAKTVSFAAGAMMATLTVPTVADSLHEAGGGDTNYLRATLGAGAGYTLGTTAAAQLDLNEGGEVPVASFRDAADGLTVSEDVGTVEVVVTLTEPFAHELILLISDVAGSATRFNDYTAGDSNNIRPLTFAPGSNQATLTTLAIVDDLHLEDTELFDLDLFARGGEGDAIDLAQDAKDLLVTIEDNDNAQLALRAAAGEVAEGGDVVIEVRPAHERGLADCHVAFAFHVEITPAGDTGALADAAAQVVRAPFCGAARATFATADDTVISANRALTFSVTRLGLDNQFTNTDARLLLPDPNQVAVTVREDEVAGMPAITVPNVYRVPAPLSVDLSGITGDGGTTGIAGAPTYNWQRFDADGTTLELDAIGAAATYTLAAADVGKKLKVQVSYTDDGGNSVGTFTSAAVPGGTGTVTAAATCNAPTYTGGAVQVWTGTGTVGRDVEFPRIREYGFGADFVNGALDDDTFTLGSNNYEIWRLYTTGTQFRFSFQLFNRVLTADDRRTLVLHACDEPFAFSAATHAHARQLYYWPDGPDWSDDAEVTLYLSRDLVAPTFDSAAADGTSLVITFDEPLGPAANLANGDFKVTKDPSDTDVPLGATAPVISGSTVTLTLATALTSTDTNVKVDYTPPTTGSNNRLTDLFGNEAASFSEDADNNTLPRILIAANQATYTAKVDRITYTLTREGDTAADLAVSVTLTPPTGNDWNIPAANLTRAVTFAAGEAEAELRVRLRGGFEGIGLPNSATIGGTLTAGIAALSGYDTSDTAAAEILVLPTPVWTLRAEQTALQFTEEGGAQETVFLLRAASAQMPPPAPGSNIPISLATGSVSAAPAVDFEVIAGGGILDSSAQFDADADGFQVGRLVQPITILQDEDGEGDEQFTFTVSRGPGWNEEIGQQDNTITITIRDDDVGVAADDGIAVTSTPTRRRAGAVADDTYRAGDVIEITMRLVGAAAVVDTTGGTPHLEFGLGSERRNALYDATLSSGDALVFRYTVQAADEDSDGIELLNTVPAGDPDFGDDALKLNGALITSAIPGGSVDLVYGDSGPQDGHRVDGVAPTATAAAADGTTLVITFTETLGAAANLANGAFAVTRGSGDTTVALGTAAPVIAASALTLTLAEPLTATDTNVKVTYTQPTTGSDNRLADAVGNEVASFTYPGQGQSAVSIAQIPRIASVAPTAAPTGGFYGAGDMISITVTFDLAVTVDSTGGTPRFGVDLGGTTRQAAYASGSGTTALVFTYTVQAGEEDADGIAWAANALDPNGGTIKRTHTDAAQQLDAVLAHTEQGPQAGHKVDGVAPTDTAATVNGASLVITFDETLAAAASLANADFAVTKGDPATTVALGSTDPAISGSTVTLTLATALTSTDTNVKVTYTQPTTGTGNRLADAAGNEVATFTRDVVNQLAGNAAGAPVITVPNVYRVPALLSVDLSGITDADGVTGIAGTATYNWQRFDADGTTLEMNAIGTGATYTLAAADVGKKLKVQVRFTDDGGNAEGPLTSAAVPGGTDTVTTAATCNAPTYSGGAVEVWSGTVTVGRFNLDDYGFFSFGTGYGALDDTTFTLGSNDYEIEQLSVFVFSSEINLDFDLNGSLTADEVRTLVLHACDEPFALSAAQHTASAHAYTWVTDDPDWSDDSEVTLYLSQDTVAPTVASAAADGDSLVITFTEPLGAAANLANAAFGVTKGSGNDTVALGSTAPVISGSTVTLTLGTALTSTDTNVKVTYTKPDSGTNNRLADAFGNEVATFTEDADNNTADTTAPGAESATVSGATLVITFDEPLAAAASLANAAFGVTKGSGNDTVALSSTAPVISGSTVTLTLGTAIAAADTNVKVTYTRPTTGTNNRLADAAGNETATFTREVRNLLGDTDPPVLAEVDPALLAADGETLTLTFNEPLDEASEPSPADFMLHLGGQPGAVQTVAVSGSTVVLTLAAEFPARPRDTVTVSYTRGTNPVRDLAQNAAADFADQAVENRTVAAPGAPRSVSATPGNRQALLSWAEPAADGGAGITGYEYRVSADGGATWDPDWTPVPDGPDAGTDPGDEREVTVMNLDNGVAYTFEVRAFNGTRHGAPGRASATLAADPAADPGPVRGLQALALDRGVALGWSAPLDDGNRALVRYEVRHARGGSVPAGARWTDAGLATDYTVGGLDNGVAYTFEVRAVNAADRAGPARQVRATPSAAATTVAPPAPQGLRAEAGEPYVDRETDPAVRPAYVDVTLYWRVDENHYGEYEYRYAEGSRVPGATPWQRAQINGTELTWVIHGLAPGARYTFEARGVARREAAGDPPVHGPVARTALTLPRYTGRTVTLALSGTAREGEPFTLAATRSDREGDTYLLFEIRDVPGPGASVAGGPVYHRRADFAAGQSRAAATFMPRYDGVRDPARSFTVRIGEVHDQNYAIDTRRLSVAVRDHEAGLSVADASVREGPGAALAFTVRLDRAWPVDVTVDYRTREGSEGSALTAVAGQDFTAVSGTLRLPAGSRSATVRVPVLDDAVDDDGETLTLALSNARSDGRDGLFREGKGVLIDDAEAVGTIRNADPLPAAWLARFGRAAAVQVTDLLGERFETAGNSPDRLILGGRDVDVAALRETLTDPGRLYRAEDRGQGDGGQGDGGQGTVGRKTVDGGRKTVDGGLGNLAPAADGHTETEPAGQAREATVLERAAWTLLNSRGKVQFDARQFLAQSRFDVSLTDLAANSGAQDHQADGEVGQTSSLHEALHRGRWSLWGRGALTRFSGQDGGLSLSGDVLTGLVGLDYARERWLAGAALAWHDGDGTYQAGPAGSGALDSTLITVNPYLRYAVNERLSAWGTLGYGAGTLQLRQDGRGRSNMSDDILTPTPGIGDAIETDLRLAMGAAGLRGVLYAGVATQLAVKTDALWVRTASEATDGMQGASADVSRLRLLLSGRHRRVLPNAALLSPNVELGIRYDEGDAETGFGMELGGGLRYADAALGLSVETKARALIAHEDGGYEEWGLSGSVSLDPGRLGRGLALNLSSGWGVAESNAQAMWQRQSTAGIAPQQAMAAQARFAAQAGYGLDVPWTHGVLTPYTGLEWAGPSRTLRLGWRFTLGQSLSLSLDGERREDGFSRPEHALMLRTSLPW